jgi:hypothetical protein
MWRLQDISGLTLLEVLLALAAVTTLTGMAIPLASNTLDDLRTASAARYLEARIQSVRMTAVTRSTAIGLRFEQANDDYTFAEYSDGNGNGIRAAEIREGIDRPLRQSERLGDRFAGVRFELMEGAPDADGDAGNGLDGVRIGAARILTMSSDGTATSGTLYIRGRRGQYAVRVLGVTGRTRMLQYRPGDHAWISR